MGARAVRLNRSGCGVAFDLWAAEALNGAVIRRSVS